MTTTPDDSAPAAGMPPSLRVGLLVMAAQGVALIAAVVVLLIDVATGSALVASTVWGLIAAFIGFAVFLALAIWSFRRGQRWPRGIVVTWQLLLAAAIVTIGVPWWVMVPVAASALAVLVTLLHPDTSRYLTFTRR